MNDEMMKGALDQRISNLRTGLRAEKVDAVFISSRQNSRYAAGFTGSTSAILISLDKQEVFVDSRYTEQAKEQCLGFDVHEVAGLFAHVVESAKAQGISRLGLEERDLTWAQLQSLEKLFLDYDIDLVPVSDVFASLRTSKDEVELAYIREAVRIADEAWEMTLAEIKPGVAESYVAAMLEHNMRLLGAEGPSFETIIASGYRSAMPHGVASDKLIEEGDAIVMDFGAMYKGYCSDITRTVFVGHAPEDMERIWHIVNEANLACEAGLKAGMTGAEGDALARDPIAEAGFADKFTHSTGHSLGLDIHETPGLAKSYTEPLPLNCLMTIEPGIYLAGVGGVRIEDTVILKEDGIEILTQADRSLRIL